MNYPVSIKSFLTLLALLACVPGYALTLGGARGAVLVGKPLDVSVAIRFEPEEDEASFCFDADVLYGDVRQDKSRVRVAFVASSAPNSASVRVLSSAPVDEPMVTVFLRAGCSQKTSRRYVLLSDVPSELAMPANPPLIAPVASPVKAAPQAGKVSAQRKGATGSADNAQAKFRPGVRQASADAGVNVVAGAPAGLVTPADDASHRTSESRSGASGKSRLKVTPLDVFADHDPVLKYSQELLSRPTDNPQRRAEAASLWRALNMRPEEVLREVGRVQGLDTDMQVLRALTAKNQGSLLELKSRLKKAESERYANGLVYTLAALLMASIVGMFLLWKRAGKARISEQDWWHSAQVDDGEPVLQARAQRSKPEMAPVPARSAVTDLDIDLGQAEEELERQSIVAEASMPQTAPAQKLAAPARAPAASDFSHSMSGTLLTVNTQEVVDARQQAEFFVALGEYENAIDVLSRCIHGEGDTSPLVFLDLFKLYHGLGRRTEYQKLREQFNGSFSSRVPEFAAFGQEGHGLEHFADAMARIADAWPSARVLDIIEDYLMASPYADSSHYFDLAAFRDLLTLHALAKALLDDPTGR